MRQETRGRFFRRVRQLATREWWDGGCSGFELVTSTETLNEAGEGDPMRAAERLALLRGPTCSASDE